MVVDFKSLDVILRELFISLLAFFLVFGIGFAYYWKVLKGGGNVPFLAALYLIIALAIGISAGVVTLLSQWYGAAVGVQVAEFLSCLLVGSYAGVTWWRKNAERKGKWKSAQDEDTLREDATDDTSKSSKHTQPSDLNTCRT